MKKNTYFYIALFLLFSILFSASVYSAGYLYVEKITSDKIGGTITCPAGCEVSTWKCIGLYVANSNILVQNVTINNCKYAIAVGNGYGDSVDSPVHAGGLNRNLSNIRIRNVQISNPGNDSRDIFDSTTTNANYLEFENTSGLIKFKNGNITVNDYSGGYTGLVGLGKNVFINSNDIYFRTGGWPYTIQNIDANISFYKLPDLINPLIKRKVGAGIYGNCSGCTTITKTPDGSGTYTYSFSVTSVGANTQLTTVYYKIEAAPPTYSCTGLIDSNAILYQDDNIGLTALDNNINILVDANTSTKCEWYCKDDFHKGATGTLDENICLLNCSPGDTNTVECNPNGCPSEGTKTQICDANGLWGEWSDCTGCFGSENDNMCTALNGCSGERNRSCDATCNFTIWSTCTNSGTCIKDQSNCPECLQSTETCESTPGRLGTRDNRGDCSDTCSCIEDAFTYSCVIGKCGATAQNATSCGFGEIFDDCRCIPIVPIENSIIDFNGFYDGNIYLGIRCAKDVIEDANLRVSETTQGTRLFEDNNCLAQSEWIMITSSIQVLIKNSVYEITLTIPKPCNICSKTIFIPILDKKESNIPDSSPLIVLLIVSIVLIVIPKSKRQ